MVEDRIKKKPAKQLKLSTALVICARPLATVRIEWPTMRIKTPKKPKTTKRTTAACYIFNFPFFRFAAIFFTAFSCIVVLRGLGRSCLALAVCFILLLLLICVFSVSVSYICVCALARSPFSIYVCVCDFVFHSNVSTSFGNRTARMLLLRRTIRR